MFSHTSGKRREWIIAHGDETPAPELSSSFQAIAVRRQNGEPLAYLLGMREFYSRSFSVSPAVLIPRPETEALVDWAIRHAPRHSRLLDLGTGSGALAISIALERPDLSVWASDLSQPALAVARHNARELGASVQFLEGSWWDAVAGPDQTWQTIVSNPPYIAQADQHLNQGDLRFEPGMALASGTDGLDAIRVIVGGARQHLSARGHLALEHGYDQREAVARLLSSHGFSEVWTESDDQGHPRLSGGQSPAGISVV